MNLFIFVIFTSYCIDRDLIIKYQYLRYRCSAWINIFNFNVVLMQLSMQLKISDPYVWSLIFDWHCRRALWQLPSRRDQVGALPSARVASMRAHTRVTVPKSRVSRWITAQRCGATRRDATRRDATQHDATLRDTTCGKFRGGRGA